MFGLIKCAQRPQITQILTDSTFLVARSMFISAEICEICGQMIRIQSLFSGL